MVRTPHVVVASARPFANENNPSVEAAVAAAPGAMTRRLMAAVARAEQANLKHAIFGNPCVHDVRNFPFAAELERNWTIIRSELARVMMRKDASSGFRETGGDADAIGRDRAWKIYPFANYGALSERNIDACPETWRLLQKVPGLVSAMFSILEPGQRLPLHRGPYNGILRLHLGLIVPEPRERLGIRIAGELHRWDEGKALIFDDAFDHEAWNDTEHTRVVLFVDFVKPLRFAARIANRLLLSSFLFRPFIREGIENQRWWERRFYREAQALREAAARQALLEHAKAEAAAEQAREAVAAGDASELSDNEHALATAAGDLKPRGEWPFDKV